MARGPQNLRVSVNGQGLSQFGGVTLIEQFPQREGGRQGRIGFAISARMSEALYAATPAVPEAEGPR